MPDSLKRLRIFADTLPLAFSDSGTGTPLLLLHGGAGPSSMAGLSALLADDYRVILPVHPGFDDEPRPEWLAAIGTLAAAYLVLIEKLDLGDVTIVGNSAGGWIAAEMALRGSPRISGIVLMNAVGIDTGQSGKPIVDPTSVAPEHRSALAFHDPARFGVAPQTPEAMATLARNQQALLAYAGDPFMHDPRLRQRLRNLHLPALVLWGTSDGIVDVDYGHRFAASIPGSRFEPVAQAGHFPQIEQADVVRRLIDDFVGCWSRDPHACSEDNRTIGARAK